MSSDSESRTPHVRMCNHPPPEASKCFPECPDECTPRPDKSGEDLFLRASNEGERVRTQRGRICTLNEGESVTHRFDCNTVDPVLVASVYGSRTLTHSAAHVLDNSKDHASSPQCEAISLKTDGTPVVEQIDSVYKPPLLLTFTLKM